MILYGNTCVLYFRLKTLVLVIWAKTNEPVITVILIVNKAVSYIVLH